MTISGEEIPAIPDVLLIEDTNLREILLALKQTMEIRNGTRGDVNQRFITYYELIDLLRGNDVITVVATSQGHNHDTLYALVNHGHQVSEIQDVEGVYALVGHGHEGVYAPLGQTPDREDIADQESIAYFHSII